MRAKHHWKPWSAAEERRLAELADRGATPRVIEQELDRTENAIDVVAEGVETSEQDDLLRKLDCPLAQGYLWSRPVAPEAFLAMLNEGRVSQLVLPAWAT